MDDFGFLSVVPPLLTIFVALYSRDVLLALVVGIVCGSFIITGFRPFDTILNSIEDQVLQEIGVASQAQVIITMMIIGGFVKLLEVSGGARAFARRMTAIVSTKARAQLMAWGAGLGIFFTDSGNALIVGPLFRSVFDEFKVCREKLAYILDTTSSPISILIPFIGWGAYIMSLIERNYATIGLEDNAFTVLVSVIPYNFYAFLALLTVPIVIWTGREFGPMRRMQHDFLRALEAEGAPGAAPEAAVEQAESRLGIFLYPLGVMLVLVLGLIIWHATHGGINGIRIRSTLIISYLSASLTCAEMMRRYQGRSYRESVRVFIQGAESLVYVSVVLVLAWSLTSVTQDLKTADYLASIISGTVPPAVFPMLVFVLGAIISLSTGSSYGTFAILMAIAVPVGFELGASMYLTIAAVLSGGLMGDHCSPISDTTVLASVGADCEHLNHVTSQGAYAAVTGLATILAFFLGGIYDTWVVIGVAILFLGASMLGVMRIYGSAPVRAAPIANTRRATAADES
jgi:Na+/H+ antiporter NhaC